MIKKKGDAGGINHPATIIMPNWVFCELHVTGPAAEITRFVNAHMGKPIQWPTVYGPSGDVIFEDTAYLEDPTDYFCFNALIPCPEEVISRGFDSIRSGDPLDGYHWVMKNWGCKWDIWPMKLTREAIGYTGESCTELKLSFDTANTAPLGWLSIITETFPELQINFECCCFESCFGYTIHAHNGDADFKKWTREEVLIAFFGEDE